MHKLGCPKRNNLYADCICEKMEHAELLKRIEDLSTALRDAISTYVDAPEIVVTAERQEAWTAALQRSGT